MLINRLVKIIRLIALPVFILDGWSFSTDDLSGRIICRQYKSGQYLHYLTAYIGTYMDKIHGARSKVQQQVVQKSEGNLKHTDYTVLVEFYWYTDANAVIWLAEPLHAISH